MVVLECHQEVGLSWDFEDQTDFPEHVTLRVSLNFNTHPERVKFPSIPSIAVLSLRNIARRHRHAVKGVAALRLARTLVRHLTLWESVVAAPPS